MPDSTVAPAISSDATLYVTRRTVMSDGHVYPTQNICHFGPGRVPIFPLPTVVVVLSALVWLLVAALSLADEDLTVPAWLLFLIFAGACAWRVINPKREGLLITMNSGDSRLFKTTDKRGAEQVALVMRQLWEQVEGADVPQIITVNDHSVQVTGGSFEGPVVMGSVTGQVHR